MSEAVRAIPSLPRDPSARRSSSIPPLLMRTTGWRKSLNTREIWAPPKSITIRPTWRPARHWEANHHGRTFGG